MLNDHKQHNDVRGGGGTFKKESFPVNRKSHDYFHVRNNVSLVTIALLFEPPRDTVEIVWRIFYVYGIKQEWSLCVHVDHKNKNPFQYLYF